MTARTQDTLQKFVFPVLIALTLALVTGGWNLKANRSEVAAVRDSLRTEARIREVTDSAWKAQTSATLQEILISVRKR